MSGHISGVPMKEVAGPSSVFFLLSGYRTGGRALPGHSHHGSKATGQPQTKTSKAMHPNKSFPFHKLIIMYVTKKIADTVETLMEALEALQGHGTRPWHQTQLQTAG